MEGGARTELENSWEATPVVLVTDGQRLWRRRKGDVLETQFGGGIDRTWGLGCGERLKGRCKAES